ncbi:MAG: replicative DNA helicase, partial [Glaciecola sp.]
MQNNQNNKSDDVVEKLKIPPHSIEAEQSVIGSMLIEPDTWDKVAEIVIESDFYNRSHQTIYRSILKLLSQNQPVDLITVSQILEQNDELDDAGGFAYLAELAKNTPSAANVVSYAKIIKERAITRELIGVAHDIAEISYHPEGRDSTDILDFAESKVFEIAEKRTGENEGPKNIESVLGKTIDRLDALVKNGKEVTGVSSGFIDLDKKTSGLQPSDLIIVAARPSMGKTTFAMNLAENAMMLEEKPVLVFSLEMPAESIANRLLSSI